jgi:hypothetical protein
MEDDIIPFDRLGGSDLVAGSILAGGSAGNYADEPIHHALPVGIQGGIRYSRLDGSVRLVVLYSTMADEEWPDRLDSASGRLTYYGDNKVPGRPLLDTTPGGNAMLAELDSMGLETREQRAVWPPFFVFSKPGTTKLSGWSRRFEGVFVPDDTPGEPWLVPRAFDGPKGRFDNFVLSLRRLDTKLVSRDWIDSVLAGDPCGPGCPEEYRRWVESGASE